MKSKLKAGALYYAILIAIIVGVVLTMIIMQYGLADQSIQRLTAKDQLRERLQNMVEVALANPEKMIDGSLVLPDSLFKVDLIAKPWGFWYTLNASAGLGIHELNKTALVGQNHAVDSTVFYVSDTKTSINVSGLTEIIGNAYLPNGTYKKTSFRGKISQIKRPFKGRVLKSQSNLPATLTSTVQWFEKSMKFELNGEDSILHIDDAPSKIDHSFDDKTLVLYANEDVYLQDMQIAGNVVLAINGNVNVSATNKFEHAIVLGKNIFVKSGFQGAAQIIAHDTLVVETSCQFNYPSVLGVANFESNPTLVQIGRNCDIAGGVMLFQTKQPKYDSKLILEEGTQVYGQVVSNGMVEVYGQVHGPLYTQKLGFTASNRSRYINQLHDIQLRFDALSANYVRPLFFKQIQSMEVIEWLN